MLVGLPPAVGVLARIPGRKGGGKILKMDGAFAPRVLRFDGPFGPKGCGIAAFGGDEYKCCLRQRPLWRVLGNGGNVSLWQQRRENQTTGLRRGENKPTALSGA